MFLGLDYRKMYLNIYRTWSIHHSLYMRERCAFDANPTPIPSSFDRRDVIKQPSLYAMGVAVCHSGNTTWVRHQSKTCRDSTAIKGAITIQVTSRTKPKWHIHNDTKRHFFVLYPDTQPKTVINCICTATGRHIYQSYIIKSGQTDLREH